MKKLDINIYKKGISLKSIGVNEVAFYYNDALSFIHFLEQEGAIIYGGDVLKISNNLPEYTYDNWCYGGKSSDESIKKARDYILSYKNKEKVLFSIVSNYQLLSPLD